MISQSVKDWHKSFEVLSKNFTSYGKFLPEQEILIDRLYESIFKTDKPVSVLVAPPASGKTHIICILAQVLQNDSKSVVIVTPSNYLKKEFENERIIIKGELKNVKIFTLTEFLKTPEKFDYVIIDESHNLKSFIELDEKVVKTVSIQQNMNTHDLIMKHLPHGKSFVAKQVSFSSARDILNSLRTESGMQRYLKEVLEDPTSWKAFVFIGRNYPVNIVRFLKSEPIAYPKLPRIRLLLFSATSLSDEELSFYCGIDKSQVLRVQPVPSSSSWRREQRSYVGLIDEMDETVKIKFLNNLIDKTKCKTLVLFSNSYHCKKFYESCKSNLRILSIPNEFEYNKQIFEKFNELSDGVLFSSSSIFWEGITIKDLTLLVIVDIPYPRPSLLDLVKNNVSDSNQVTIRRLEQGVGRIGRRKGERGIGVFLFNPNLKLEKWIKSFKKHENYSDEFSWNITDKCASFLNPRS